MTYHPKGNKEDEGSRPQATADISKTSSRCQAHRTPQGQQKPEQNPTAEEPRVANVSEPLWKPGLQTGRNGRIQAGTVLSGEHRRQTGEPKGVSDGQKLRETSKTRDPGHRQLLNKNPSLCKLVIFSFYIYLFIFGSVTGNNDLLIFEIVDLRI